MRTIVLSDCHGQPWLISNVLENSEYDKRSDRLVFAGDILDIGLDPMKCMTLLEEANAEILWGNHDLAHKLGRPIWPVNQYFEEVYQRLELMSNSFKVAAHNDEVLITHAGLSDSYEQQLLDLFDFYEPKAARISNYLNSISLSKLYCADSGPLWYRPNSYDRPVSIKQVVGHTPPVWSQQLNFKNFHSVDPWCPVGFDQRRYRYAVIEDNEVTVVDSN